MRTIGIIGCGNMGEAIIKNLKSKGLKGHKLAGADKDAGKRKNIQRKYRIKAFGSNKEMVKKSDIVILAVKPQDAKKVLDSLGVTRYCCRRMLLSHVEIADEILKFYEEKGRRKQLKPF